MTRNTGLYGALALLLAVNAAVLGHVAWNRLGPTDATVRLTERELPLQLRRFGVGEDSGLTLDLKVHQPYAALQWLDEAKLRQLGFRPEDYGGRQAAEPWEARRRALPRRVYLVLEFDGPAWQAVLAERDRRIEELAAELSRGEATVEQVRLARAALQNLRRGGSRLVPVDAGRDAPTLRRHYADRARYLITAARIGMGVERVPPQQDDQPLVRGYIEQLLPAGIHVPLQHRAALQAALGDEPASPAQSHPRAARPPRYAVVLHYGARHEPWVGAIQPLPPTDSQPAAAN